MSETVKDHLRSALALMLKPLVRLMISQGVTHADFAETTKEVYVEIAIRHFAENHRVNKSKIAILTGLTRKEVKNVIDKALDNRGSEKRLSRPERVLNGWYSDPFFTGPYGIPLELPYEDADREAPSFVKLVRTYSGDMAPRQMLEELTRSGSIVELDSRYKVLRRVYEPVALSPELIGRLGEIGYRVFSTAARNIEKSEQGSGHFDRLVVADEGCTKKELDEFDPYVKSKGQALLEDFDVWFSKRSKDRRTSEHVYGTGVYMVHYVEEETEKQGLSDLLNKAEEED